MNQTISLHPALVAAVVKIQDFITHTTGCPPTPEELAHAMTKYFVLNEILGFVEMSRDTPQ
ncbi:MAG: hypothetical protein HUK40_02460 [Desulfobacter sp.]|nr:hypothetical protein [Desulfobacter sp.]WDP85329.1 MAG: hypothetical protein HUN05_09455 [Desulfobacter sp.]